jgi:hypothetical protein
MEEHLWSLPDFARENKSAKTVMAEESEIVFFTINSPLYGSRRVITTVLVEDGIDGDFPLRKYHASAPRTTMTNRTFERRFIFSVNKLLGGLLIASESLCHFGRISFDSAGFLFVFQ